VFFYGAAYQKSQSAAFTLREKGVPAADSSAARYTKVTPVFIARVKFLIQYVQVVLRELSSSNWNCLVAISQYSCPRFTPN